MLRQIVSHGPVVVFHAGLFGAGNGIQAVESRLGIKVDSVTKARLFQVIMRSMQTATSSTPMKKSRLCSSVVT